MPYKDKNIGKQKARERYLKRTEGKVKRRTNLPDTTLTTVWHQKENARLKYRYGITIHEYKKLLTEQNYTCKICHLPEKIKDNKLCVDHNHKTGKIRGLLCRACNSAIGKFKDDLQIILRAYNYIAEDISHD